MDKKTERELADILGSCAPQGLGLKAARDIHITYVINCGVAPDDGLKSQRIQEIEAFCTASGTPRAWELFVRRTFHATELTDLSPSELKRTLNFLKSA